MSSQTQSMDGPQTNTHTHTINDPTIGQLETGTYLRKIFLV